MTWTCIPICGRMGVLQRERGREGVSLRPHGTESEVSMHSNYNLFGRFFSKVDSSGGSDSCWEWQGAIRGRSGYGNFFVSGFTLVAHRVAYSLCVGPVPEGFDLHHTCRNRSCVNPDHLKPITHRENCLLGVGTPASNFLKTHCDHGHVFDLFNTYYWHGERYCRACRREFDRKRRLRVYV